MNKFEVMIERGVQSVMIMNGQFVLYRANCNIDVNLSDEHRITFVHGDSIMFIQYCHMAKINFKDDSIFIKHTNGTCYSIVLGKEDDA